VDHGTRVFWSLIALLLGASAYFAAGIDERRGSTSEPDARSAPAALDSDGH